MKVVLSRMLREIMEKLADYQRNGSGWYFKEVISLEIHTVDYKTLKGESYIPLPDFLMRKKAIINMENKDNRCFLWSVLRYLHPKQSHGERLTDETAAVKMPTKNTILNFQNHFKKLPNPFVIYADFECFRIPMNSCQPNPNKSFTEGYQKHEPSGYALYLKGLDGMEINYKPIVYTKKTEDEDISKKIYQTCSKINIYDLPKILFKTKTLQFNSSRRKRFPISNNLTHL